MKFHFTKQLFPVRLGFLVFTLLFMGLGTIQAADKASVITKGRMHYLSNEVIVKTKHGNSIESFTEELQKIVSVNQKNVSVRVMRAFPDVSYSEVGIERIYRIVYDSKIDPLMLSQKLSKSVSIQWIEPRFVYETSVTPNDPFYSQQWGLNRVAATQAWDVTQGDTSVVIGIVDTGVDWDHPDLAANIWKNSDEIPLNGMDDDNNGYVDDYRGWDFGGLNGTADNNPMEDRPDHGTNVAGIASAVTNNGVGVAGMGYACRLMPIKTSQDDYRNLSGQPYIIFGYEGIVYAANNGCRVINCSWGGYSFSLYGQDAVNYAISRNALVVAAAGNDNSADTHYPSGFSGVLSVASSATTDAKSSFSNYGISVDVTSPGESIYNTWQDNTYAFLSGTSMASPLTAGLAGLVASKFPGLSAMQVGERVRVSCDNIESVNTNYRKMLGRGRINAYTAVTRTDIYSVRAEKVLVYEYSGDGDGILEPNETGGVRINFKNYLNPVNSVAIGLESHSVYASVSNASYFSTNTYNTGEQFDNSQNPFTFTVAANTPPNTEIRFSVNYTVNGFQDWQGIITVVNPTFATQSNDAIKITITSKGTFGYNDYPDNLQGIGFTYNGSNSLLFEGALIMGNSASKISDAARNSVNGNTQNSDFTSVKPFALTVPGSFADVEGLSVFSDAGAGSNALGIICSLKTYTYSSEHKKNFIILQYHLKNTSSTTISNFYTGLFTDWDMVNGQDDYTAYDTQGRLGYVYHVGTTPAYIGVVALRNNDYTIGYYGILNPGGDGGINVYDGFSDAEKWTVISSGLTKLQAGAGDVSMIVSAGPFAIFPSPSIVIGYAIVGGQSLDEIRTAAQSARNCYDLISSTDDNQKVIENRDFTLYTNYPNPFNPATKIRFYNPSSQVVKVSVFDMLGREVATLLNTNVAAGEHEVVWDAANNAAGVYICKVKTSVQSLAIPMVLLK